MIGNHKSREKTVDYSTFDRFVFGFAVSDDAYGQRGAGFNIFMVQTCALVLAKHFGKTFKYLQIDSWKCENHYFEGHTFRYYFVAALFSKGVSKL